MRNTITYCPSPLTGINSYSRSAFMVEEEADNHASFLGMFEGKRKRAKADAEATVINAEADAEIRVLQAKAEAVRAGYKTPEQIKAEAEKVEADAGIFDAQSSNTLYYVLGAVVLIVMVGLYFITKSR